MTKFVPPRLVIPSFDSVQTGPNASATKGFISSLLRSLYSGPITVFRNHELPLFKVERAFLDEVVVAVETSLTSATARRQVTREFLFGLCDITQPDARQWVIVAHSRSLALRNIDHLIPLDHAGPYPPPEVDFYWTQSSGGEISKQSATPGLWAVRGEHLPLVLERFKEAWSEEGGEEIDKEEEIWTRVVKELPLRKRAFEKGEVVAPRIGAVDWDAVSNAAFVTLPDWPEIEAWKFLQAMYLGTYLGDETGMMLNILEA